MIMDYDELVFGALAYRRHTGATLSDIRTYIRFREAEKHTQAQDRQVLRRLEDSGLLFQVGQKWFFTPAGAKQAKGPALKPEWQSADAWILLSILCCGGDEPICLSKIIGVADWINHAIPTLEEMHGALNRLASGRLLKTKRDMFQVTDKSDELFAKVEANCGRAVLDQLDGLRRLLDCPCCGVKLTSVTWKIPLDSATMHTAYEDYRKLVR